MLVFVTHRWFGVQLNPHFMGVDLKYVNHSLLHRVSFPDYFLGCEKCMSKLYLFFLIIICMLFTTIEL